MDLIRKPIRPELDAYAAWETSLGESIVHRAAGRILAATGIEAPERLWGLVVVTPTRLVFRHFSQPHPLFGGRDDEVLWEVLREGLVCEVRGQNWWNRLLSGLSDHCALTRPGVELVVETAERARDFAAAWSSSSH